MEKGKIIEAKNIAYFQALANSRASLTQLGIALVAGLPTGLLLTWLLKQASVYAHIVEFKGGVYVFAFLTVFMGLIGVSSFFTKTVYHFQNFFSALFCVLVIILTVFIWMLCYFAVLYVKANTMFSPSGLFGKIIILLSVVIFLFSIGVNIYLLHHRLKIGFSETRTNKNFLAVTGVYSSKILGIIFGMVMLVPPILTQGKYLMNMFGVLCILGISIIFLSPIVEFSYLAYLKSKSKIYWEKAPLRKIKISDEKIKLKKRIILILYLALSILSVYLVGGVFFNVLPSLVTVCVVLLMLISYVVLIIIWLARKIDDKKKLIKKRKMKHKRKLMNKGKRKEKRS